MRWTSTNKIPRYDPTTDRGYLTRGKHERGTTRYETYGSLQCVEEGMGRAQIVCEHVGLFDENSELVAKLLESVTREHPKTAVTTAFLAGAAMGALVFAALSLSMQSNPER